MLDLVYSVQFKKDFKKIRKLPIADLKAVFSVIQHLENQDILSVKYQDHALIGSYAGFRECHIKPDLLLIFKVEKTQLQLTRIGSHSELF